MSIIHICKKFKVLQCIQNSDQISCNLSHSKPNVFYFIAFSSSLIPLNWNPKSIMQVKRTPSIHSRNPKSNHQTFEYQSFEKCIVFYLTCNFSISLSSADASMELMDSVWKCNFFVAPFWLSLPSNKSRGILFLSPFSITGMFQPEFHILNLDLKLEWSCT